MDDFQANRSPDKRYRTTPLNGLWTHAKGGFYHDARFPTLQDVIAHYDSCMSLGLSGQEKMDLTRAINFPVYVLIDRNCGSSCELTLEALEKLSYVQTIGENTTGVVQYGNVGALFLPSSHIVIRIPTQGSKYDDQRQVEKIGYTPKWKVPLGTDALEYTLSHFFTD